MLHEDFITTKEASNLFKYTPSYLAHLVRNKKINAHKLGRSWLIEKNSLLHFIAQQGKQDAKNTYTRAHPRSQEHQTYHAAIMPVTPPPTIQPNTIQHHNVSDAQHHPSLNWIGKIAPAIILVIFTATVLQFGPILVQSPMLASWTGTIRTLPGSISRIPLAIGEFVITTTHAVIAADAALAYGIAAAAPATAQVAVKLFLNIGDNLSKATARIPVQMASVFAHGVQ